MSVWKSDEKLLIFASLFFPSKVILIEKWYRWIKHLAQCFITRWNTLKFMKNTSCGSFFKLFSQCFIWCDIEWHLPFIPAVFVLAFCLWCEISARSVNQSHHLHKVFLLSALTEITQTLYNWGSSYHLLLYKHWPFCPFVCVAIIIPIQNNIEISVLQFHVKVSRPFKYVGGGGFAYYNTFL